MKYRLVAEIILLILLAPWLVLSAGMYFKFLSEAF